MRVLWLCGLPRQVQEEALTTGDSPNANASWSWIVSHLPCSDDIDLHVICPWPGGTTRQTFEYNNANWHIVPTLAKGRTATFYQFDRAYYRTVVKEIKPDVIHGWGTETSYGLLATQLAPKSHVVSVQGLITEYRKTVKMQRRQLLVELIEKYTLRRAGKVFVESGYSRDIAQPLCGKHTKLSTIDHPLRHEFLHTKAADGTKKNVVFVGSIIPRKGVSDAVRAFAAAAPEDWTLTLIGNGPQTMVSSMQSLARETGIVERLRHIPSMEAQDIAKLLGDSAIFLLPTKIDTGPTALKEALSMGLWPVCYDNSGPGEYLRHFNRGHLAADGDVADLTDKLKTAIMDRPWLSMNDDQRAERLRHIRHHFSPQTAWQKLTAAYCE